MTSTLDTATLTKMAHDYVAAHDKWAATGVGHKSSAALVRRMDAIMNRAEHADATAALVAIIDFLFTDR